VTTNAEKLKAIFARRDATIMPGTPNALFANVIETLGYECAYVTGAGVSNMTYGIPDIGLVTVTEMTEHVSAITDSISIPVLVDGDTGFGNPINTRRTVKSYERAGAAGIQLEDQDFPKRCGHFSGKSIIPLSEMVQKIKAAVDARRDQNFQIVARTDAIAVEGIDGAMDRAQAFIEAGADVTFVEAPTTVAEMERIGRNLKVPQIINIVHGGKTPALSRDEMARMGFSAVLYANAALQAALFAVTDVLESLKTRGSLDSVANRLASFDNRQTAVRKDEYDRLEKIYS
jgi:2-methylisocitrate lyase-like PEP mutase family enzyme